MGSKPPGGSGDLTRRAADTVDTHTVGGNLPARLLGGIEPVFSDEPALRIGGISHGRFV